MKLTIKQLNRSYGVALLVAMACSTYAVGGSDSSPAPQVAAPTSAATTSPPFDLSDAGRIQAGKSRFNQTCAAYCHGYEGEGGKAPNFKGRTDLSPEGAFKVITEGRRGADVMPPWGKAFTSEQIWELVAYLKFLGTQKPDQ